MAYFNLLLFFFFKDFDWPHFLQPPLNSATNPNLHFKEARHKSSAHYISPPSLSMKLEKSFWKIKWAKFIIKWRAFGLFAFPAAIEKSTRATSERKTLNLSAPEKQKMSTNHVLFLPPKMEGVQRAAWAAGACGSRAQASRSEAASQITVRKFWPKVQLYRSLHTFIMYFIPRKGACSAV